MSDAKRATIEFTPIGVIHTPHTDPQGMPIQPTGAADVAGVIELYPEYAAGLQDLDGFSHLILLYHLHRSSGYDLRVVPFLDTVAHGLFATRAPRRPNAIGLSVVRLTGITGNRLEVAGVDMLDGTPLLDIKPHVPAFDAPADVRTGWFEQTAHRAASARSDDRYLK